MEGENKLSDIEAERARWRNRRKMAWVALSSMIGVTILVLFTDIIPIQRLTVLTEVITWFYFCCASVIGAYMGFTTWAAKSK